MNNKYRSLSDGSIIEAIQYSNPSRPWRQEDVARVAKFVLGHDTSTRITVANEHIMDVVRPVEERWNPAVQLADITVADWIRNTTISISIGWWLLKYPEGGLAAMSHKVFLENFELDIPKAPPKTEFDELADLIYDNFPWEGETYQAVAERVASQIVEKGWVKKS